VRQGCIAVTLGLNAGPRMLAVGLQQDTSSTLALCFALMHLFCRQLPTLGCWASQVAAAWGAAGTVAGCTVHLRLCVGHNCRRYEDVLHPCG
jgi:hypothetical protein